LSEFTLPLKTNGNVITIFANAKEHLPQIFTNAMVHEMGHAFDNAISLGLTKAFQQRVAYWFQSGYEDMPRGNNGYYASKKFGDPWIQGHHPDETAIDLASLTEETADMFLGWVYGEWNDDIPLRGQWMDFWMPYLLTGTQPPNIALSP
jgi:hypothetical protein